MSMQRPILISQPVLKDNKFGIAHEQAVAVYEQATGLSHIDIVGIDCHIGSQLTEVEPFIAALDKVIELVHSLREKGIELRHIDLGGGLGVRYIDESPVSIHDFAQALLPKLTKLGKTVFFEPGRGCQCGYLAYPCRCAKAYGA